MHQLPSLAVVALLLFSASARAQAPAVVPATPSASKAAAARPVVRILGTVGIPDLVLPTHSPVHGWSKFMPESRELSPSLAPTLEKAAAAHQTRELNKDLRKQDAKNLAFERTWRARALKELRAAERNPFDERALALLLWWDALDKGVEPVEVVAALEQGIARFEGKPGTTYLRRELAAFHYMRGEKERARALLEQLLATAESPKAKAELQGWLGALAVDRGDEAEARKLFEAAEAGTTDRDQLWPGYWLAWSYFRAGECPLVTKKVAQLVRSRGRLKGDTAAGFAFNAMAGDLLGMVAACGEEEQLGLPEGSDSLDRILGKRREVADFYADQTEYGTVTRALAACYVGLARRSPADARKLSVTGSGDFKDARFQAVLHDEPKRAWPLSEQLSACAAEKLKASAHDGTLTGEVALELRPSTRY